MQMFAFIIRVCYTLFSYRQRQGNNMKQREFTVIHAISVVLTLNRAGHNAGQTSVAKLGGVTPLRARRVLSSALRLGLLYSYNNTYRSNVERRCYALTETGRIVEDTMSQHKKTTIWELSHD